MGRGGLLEVKNITESLSLELNCPLPERLVETVGRFAIRNFGISLRLILGSFFLGLCAFPTLTYLSVRPPAFFLLFPCFAGCWSLEPWTTQGAPPNVIYIASNSILLFPYLFLIPCQPPSFLLPFCAAPSLPLLARRQAAPGTSGGCAREPLPRLRCQQASACVGSWAGRLGRRDLSLSGAAAAQWDLRAVAAAVTRCAPRGGAARQLLARRGGQEGSRYLGCRILDGVVPVPPCLQARR